MGTPNARGAVTGKHVIVVACKASCDSNREVVTYALPVVRAPRVASTPTIEHSRSQQRPSIPTHRGQSVLLGRHQAS